MKWQLMYFYQSVAITSQRDRSSSARKWFFNNAITEGLNSNSRRYVHHD